MLCVFLWLLYNVRLRIFCSHGTSPLTVVKGCNIWFHRITRYCHFNVHVRNAEIFIDASLGLISMFYYMTIWKLILTAKLFCSKWYTHGFNFNWILKNGKFLHVPLTTMVTLAQWIHSKKFSSDEKVIPLPASRIADIFLLWQWEERCENVDSLVISLLSR